MTWVRSASLGALCDSCTVPGDMVSSPLSGDPDWRGRRFFDSPLFTGINTAMCVLGSLSLAFSVVLVVLSFFDRSPFGSGEFVPFFTFAFPMWLWMFIIAAQRGLLRRSRRSGWQRFSGRATESEDWKALGSLMPRSVRWIIPVLFVAFGIVFKLSSARLRGQPHYDPSTDRYFENDHGVLIPVSHATYISAVAAQNRVFLSGALLFTSLATAVCWGEWTRRRSLGGKSWPQPLVARPRWVPPIASCLAISVIGIALTALFAHSIVARVSEYQSQAPHLEPKGSAVVQFTPGDYVVFTGCSESMACPTIEPSDLVVRGPGGSTIVTTRDPSNDHLTFASEPYVGALSFEVPHGGRFLVTTKAHGEPKLVVLHSPGQEAISLIGWIVGTVLAVIVTLYGIVSSIAWYRWRYGTRSLQIDSPLALPPWPPPQTFDYPQ